jgi:predicted N-acetyltransferase YhbS
MREDAPDPPSEESSRVGRPLRGSDGLNLRPAIEADLSDVMRVHRAAFAHDEADLVRELLFDSTAQPLVSLLAEVEGQVVGHMRAALEAAAGLGVGLVFVLGHPDYYPRVGFRPAGRLDLLAPYPISPEYADAWMVVETSSGLLGTVTGAVAPAATFRHAEQWSEAPAPPFDSDGLTPHARANRNSWNTDSAQYEADHGAQLAASGGLAWGVWQVPEADLRILGDWGAVSFTDPYLTIPEVARLLRPGGLFAFNGSTPMAQLCYPDEEEHPVASLQRDYFGMRALPYEGYVDFMVPCGEWIRLFRANGFLIEDLVEVRPAADATGSYYDDTYRDWARRWPAEQIWKVRKIVAEQ